MVNGSSVLQKVYSTYYTKTLNEQSRGPIPQGTSGEAQAKAEGRFRPETGLKPIRPLSFMTALRGIIQKKLRGMVPKSINRGNIRSIWDAIKPTPKDTKEPQPVGQQPHTRLPFNTQLGIRPKPTTGRAVLGALIRGGAEYLERPDNVIRGIINAQTKGVRGKPGEYDVNAGAKAMAKFGTGVLGGITDLIKQARGASRRSQEPSPTRFPFVKRVPVTTRRMNEPPDFTMEPIIPPEPKLPPASGTAIQKKGPFPPNNRMLPPGPFPPNNRMLPPGTI